MSSSYNSETLEGFDEFFGKILAGLSPAARHKATRRLAQELLKSNTDRIKQNVSPDGSQMEKRKPRLDRRGRLRSKQGGKMFRRLGLQREWVIRATSDTAEVSQRRNNRIARIHHEGLRAFVGRNKDGKKTYTKYPTRRLLGFAREDEELAMELAEQLLLD